VIHGDPFVADCAGDSLFRASDGSQCDSAGFSPGHLCACRPDLIDDDDHFCVAQAFLAQDVHQPLAATCLPANRGHPPATSPALPWYNVQLLQALPDT